MKKKILFLSHMYPTSFDLSYGKVIHEQAVSLKKRGYEIKVICPIPYTPFILKYANKKYLNFYNLPNKEIHDGIEVYYPRYLVFPKAILFSISGKLMFHGIYKIIKKINKTFNFNIIHAHFTMPDACAGKKLSKVFKNPLITTIQATDLDISINRDRKTKSEVYKTLKYSNEVITPSPRLQSQLNKVFNIDSNVIGYGIDLERVIIDSPEELATKYKNKIVITSVSRLINTKGIEYNIKAIRELKKKYSNIHYLIIGNGPEKENLEKLVLDLAMEDFVEFLGELRYDNAMEYIVVSDVFSLPSWQETFGLVYLEAMANKKPVIGCRGQGFDGIIEHNKNGFLAKPKDSKSIYEIIDFILSNPEISKDIGEKAHREVVDKFTFNEIACRLDLLYKGLGK